jgi:hypothetical protein
VKFWVGFLSPFFSQDAQERSAIPEDLRRSTFVYIDEAQDYFDESIQSLFNQARKYKVGLIIAHQNLDQFDQKLRAAVLSSTSIKLVGGVSAKDAGIFAKEMNCEPEFLPFGQMEKQEKLTSVQLEQVLAQHRSRYSATGSRVTLPSMSEGESISRPDLL